MFHAQFIDPKNGVQTLLISTNPPELALKSLSIVSVSLSIISLNIHFSATFINSQPKFMPTLTLKIYRPPPKI